MGYNHNSKRGGKIMERMQQHISMHINQCRQMAQQLIQQTQQGNQMYNHMLQQEQRNAQMLEQLVQRERQAAQFIQQNLRSHEYSIQKCQELIEVCNQMERELVGNTAPETTIHQPLTNQSFKIPAYQPQFGQFLQ